MFIVLEGADRTGKSTQAALVAQRLRARGQEVVETFEPGATALGGALRAIVLDPEGSIDPATESLIMATDRAHHVAQVVRPALERGAVVVSDRFVPSSLAYQGLVRGVGIREVEDLNRFATGDLEPDAVVVLDMAPGAARARNGEDDRLEAEEDEFHAAVRRAYRGLADERGWIVVDADADVEAVTERIMAALGTRLEGMPR
jgi:dTMP kinase